MEREKFQEFSPSSASHSRKFAQDSEGRNFFKNCVLGCNLEKERSSEQHPPVIFSHHLKSTLVSCVHFPSTWMSPVWNRIDKAGRAGVSERGSLNGTRKCLGILFKCPPATCERGDGREGTKTQAKTLPVISEGAPVISVTFERSGPYFSAIHASRFAI